MLNVCLLEFNRFLFYIYTSGLFKHVIASNASLYVHMSETNKYAHLNLLGNMCSTTTLKNTKLKKQYCVK